MKPNTLKLIALLLFTCMGLTTYAQDAKAKTLLDEVSKKIEGYDNMYLEFKYSFNNEETNVNQESRGNVTFMGDKYKLNLMGATQIFDGAKLYTISPADEQVTISTQNPNDDGAITPSKMLTFFNTGYTYKWDIKQNVSGREIQYIKLTPMDSNSELTSALLGVDPQTKHIYRLIMTQNNGSKITITVNSFKVDQPLTSNFFVFDEAKYADYYIDRID